MDYVSGTEITEEGVYNISVWAKDKAANETAKNLTFTIDKTSAGLAKDVIMNIGKNDLTIRWVNPAELDYKGTKIIRRTDRFAQGINDGAEIYDSAGQVYKDEGLSSGQVYYYSLFTYDLAGNYSAGANISGAADGIQPEISVTGVSEGEYYNSEKTAQITVTDINLDISFADLNGIEYISGTPISEEGSNTLYVFAKDIADNRAEKTISFVIDKTLPDILITDVISGSYYPARVAPKIEINDLHLETTAVSLNGNNYVSGTEIIEEGVYDLSAWAKDYADNENTKSVNFIIDTAKPVITMSGVTDSTYYNKDIMPFVAISDKYLDSVWTVLNGSPWTSGSVISEEGGYDLSAGGTDLAGNRTEAEISFTIDKTEPIITISGVTDSTYYNQDKNPVININELNPDTTSITLNGVNYISGTTVAQETTYVLNVYVKDKAGNEAGKETHFTIDKTAPDQPVFDALPDSTNDPKLNISGRSEPGSLVTLYYNGSSYNTATVKTDSSFIFTNIDLIEGDNKFSAVSRDKALNASLTSEQVKVVLDIIPPVIPVLIYPEDSAVVYNTIMNVMGRAEIGTAVNLEVIYETAGGYNAVVQTDTTGQFAFENAVFAEGKNNLSIWAKDTAGNEGEKLHAVVIVKLVDLEVNKKIPANHARLLVWVRDDNAERFINRIMQGQDIYYRIIKDSEDQFKEQFRSGKYNLVFLLNNETIRMKSELKERVYSGDGFIAAGQKAIISSEMADMLGIKVKGTLPEQNNMIDLMNSPISQESVIKSIGDAQRVELATGAMAGYIKTVPETDHKGKINGLNIETKYDFSEINNWKITVQIFKGNNTQNNNLLDEETAVFQSIPVEAIDLNPGKSSTNLRIKGIDDRIEFYVETTTNSTKLDGEYTFQVKIEKNSALTKIGPSKITVDKCISPADDSEYGKFRVVSANRIGKCCTVVNEPAVVLNNYGEGKTTLFTFDITGSGNDTTFSQIKELVLNSIKYTTPETSQIYPMATLPVEIIIQNKGKTADLKVREMVPEELTISDVFSGGIEQGKDIIWQFNLSENSEKSLKYYLSIPDNNAQYSLTAEIDYLDYDSSWQFYDNYTLDINNINTMYSLIQEIIDGISSMSLSSDNREKADEIVEKLEGIRSRNAAVKSEYEKNIEDILKSVNKLLEIGIETDVNTVRVKLDELLRINEVKWSR